MHPQRLLHDSLLRACEGDGAAKAAVIVEGNAYTYGELLDAASRLASALRERGVRRGDRVAIYMDNTWPCVVSIFATLIAGGAFLIVNPQTKADKLAFILDDSAARFLLSDAHFAREYGAALAQTRQPPAVISSGAAAAPAESFDAVLASAPPLAERAATIPLDLAALRWAWREAFGGEAPVGLGREFLLRFLSHRLQIQQLGDLDGKAKRILNRLASGDVSVIAAPIGLGMNLKPGTLLVREYKDELHRVTVMTEGYAWRGQTYPTLSAVARAITGANWNGYVFFGLKKKVEATATAESAEARNG